MPREQTQSQATPALSPPPVTQVPLRFGLSDPGLGDFSEVALAGERAADVYARIRKDLLSPGPSHLARVSAQSRRLMRDLGVTFNLYRDEPARENILPFDPFPRVLDAATWDFLSRGLAQRVRVWNEFFRDLYDSQEVLRNDIVPFELVYDDPRYQRNAVGLKVPDDIFVHVAAFDLARDEEGRWVVIEDYVGNTTGVTYAYSTTAGEPANPISEPLSSNRYWVHPSIVNGAQRQPGGQPDLRLTSKVLAAGRSLNLNDLIGTHKPVMYNLATAPASANLGAPIPWINNEEMLLLRAEVRWNTNNPQGAIDDLNLVRLHAGGLGASTLTSASPTSAFVTEVLYNRTYSLMWTQGTRWIDARRYGRTATLPLDRPGDIIYPNMIIPAAECDARRLPVPCTPLSNR